MKQQTLMQHLLAWTLGALLVVWGSFIGLAYLTGMHESDELTDGHLASVVSLLVSQRSTGMSLGTTLTTLPSRPDLRSHDYQQSLSIFIWDTRGQLLTRTGNAPLPVFDHDEGFATLQLGEPAQGWRTFSRWDTEAGNDRKVMALLSLQERHDLAEDIAEEIVVPGFWLLPLVALALGLAIRKGLQPLYALSRDVDALDIDRATPLPNPHPHQEFQAVVQSINTLMARHHAALVRERQLASELAHELRTPLASLALQARALRAPQALPDATPMDPACRDAALLQIERDALRAGLVLSHLLALARASRTEMAETAQPLDLDALAREVVGGYAQAALDSRHDIALVSPGPFPLRGHAVLLELALRNLVENALSHTPAGTVVEVQLNPQARWLQVVDNGALVMATPPATDGAALAPRSEWGLGLGLGHRVVEKIAAIHNARFSRETLVGPQAGWVAYRLAFDAVPVERV